MSDPLLDEENKYKKRKSKTAVAGQLTRWWRSVRNEVIVFGLLFVFMLHKPPVNSSDAWRIDLFSEYIPPHPWYSHLLKSRQELGFEDEPEPPDLWDNPDSEGWVSCLERNSNYTLPEKSTGYVQIFLEGGLNQQRIGICNAVAVARILNATLLLPEFDVNPVWQDTSTFADIFDVGYFIDQLENEVRVETQLPVGLSWSTREYYSSAFRENRVKNAPMRASAKWYLENVLPLLQTYGIVAIAPFSHRLTFDGLPDDIQRLRCRVNYQALKFVPAIHNVGDLIINRLRTGWPTSANSFQSIDEELDSVFEEEQRRIGFRKLRSSRAALPPRRPATSAKNSTMHEEFGEKNPISVELDDLPQEKYVALHLRFDKDMVAHSKCDYGGGRAQRIALDSYRSFAWPEGVSSNSESDKLRQNGKCPLTPEEVGLLLAGIGFTKNTRLYLATYKVYGGEERMTPLREMFPLIVNKTSLATAKELSYFTGHSTRLAALDYHVSLHADVFVSASAGNMYNVLAGHRAFVGVKKTIKPYPQMLASILSDRSISWDEFRRQVAELHSNRTGALRFRRAGQSIYTYPAPDCMCQQDDEQQKEDQQQKFRLLEDARHRINDDDSDNIFEGAEDEDDT
ncbi:hypothetical protein CBR_g1055 [Chara braunii]|uniref:O-fucosyltransferase family protein n=1 Tax=Chara braunii TaxID=69332 RepID=A0A388KD53_CHABU|nr:hypothetical protein CBR_g1055 [Chara braunii]|eukprot:GBG67936.1 hypothetical protein CBR_g1055 [Chara braunii]